MHPSDGTYEKNVLLDEEAEAQAKRDKISSQVRAGYGRTGFDSPWVRSGFGNSENVPVNPSSNPFASSIQNEKSEQDVIDGFIPRTREEVDAGYEDFINSRHTKRDWINPDSTKPFSLDDNRTSSSSTIFGGGDDGSGNVSTNPAGLDDDVVTTESSFIENGQPEYDGINIDEYLDMDMNKSLSTVEQRYMDILDGNDPIAQQNMNAGMTGIDRMSQNVEEQTRRQAQQMGIQIGSDQYNQLMERNQQGVMQGGSNIMAGIATQNMAGQREALGGLTQLGKFEATHGLSVGKFDESINRYGYEATMAKVADKNKMRENVMNNPNMFSVAVQEAVRTDYFKEMNIDISTLPEDPTDAEQMKTEIGEWLTTAHPDWTDDQIEAESLRRITMVSPYTNDLFEKMYNDAIGNLPPEVQNTINPEGVVGEGASGGGTGDVNPNSMADPNFEAMMEDILNPTGSDVSDFTGTSPTTGPTFDPTREPWDGGGYGGNYEGGFNF